jgi:hypothetical protein
MVARIKQEISVGMSDEIAEALEAATKFTEIKASQFGRIALVEKLCREGYLRHPGVNYQNPPEAAE